MSGSLLPDVDAAERLSADDMATRREEEFLAQARLRAASSGKPRTPTGVCANCEAPVLPQLRYCDDECQRDHEAREIVLTRQRGRAR